MSTNTFLVRYAGGWLERANSAAVSTNGRIEAMLGLGALGSVQEAYRVADAELVDTKDTREQTDVEIATRVDADLPYIGGYGVGDSVTVDGGPAHRLLGVAVSEDDATGVATVVPTLNDHLVLSPFERFAQAIGKMVPGTRGGRSKVAQPAVPVYTPRALAPIPPAGYGSLAWWKMDDAGSLTVVAGKITVAQDKTGNGYDVTAGHGSGGSGPDWGSTTLNGRNTADFDSGGFLHVPNPSPPSGAVFPWVENATIYMVVNVEDIGAVGNQSILEVQDYPFGCDLHLRYLSATEESPDPAEFGLSNGCGSGTSDGPTLAGAGTGGYLIRLTLTGPSTAEVYVGGEGTQAYTRGLFQSGGDVVNRFVFGYPSAQGWQLAEAFVFDGSAPAADATVRAYLASEWGVAA